MWILDSDFTSFYVIFWVPWSCWWQKMSSSEGGMFPVCKSSLYTCAYVACPAKSWLTWWKSFAASVTGSSTARTYVQEDQENSRDGQWPQPFCSSSYGITLECSLEWTSSSELWVLFITMEFVRTTTEHTSSAFFTMTLCAVSTKDNSSTALAIT